MSPLISTAPGEIQAAQRLGWAGDPSAQLVYVLREDVAYVVRIDRGSGLSGTQILQAFQPLAVGRRIKVLGVEFDTMGFWEKMVERGLVHDWSMDAPSALLA